MANKFWGATSLIGGGTGALDAIDGNDLTGGDGAMVVTSTTVYFYYLNSSSSDVEASPDTIVPDTNPGTKRWKRISPPLG